MEAKRKREQERWLQTNRVPRKKIGILGEGALGEGDQGHCFIKQVDEFLSPDGFITAVQR